MSTLTELRSHDLLRAWGVGGKLCHRYFYFTAEWLSFLEGLPDGPSAVARLLPHGRRRLSVAEQVRQLCNAFCEGQDVDWLEVYGKRPVFQPVRRASAVWEMSTAHTRTFGWFAGPNRFVAITGGPIIDFKKEGKSVNAKYQAAARFVEAWRIAQAIGGPDVSYEIEVNKLVPKCL